VVDGSRRRPPPGDPEGPSSGQRRGARKMSSSTALRRSSTLTDCAGLCPSDAREADMSLRAGELAGGTAVGQGGDHVASSPVDHWAGRAGCQSSAGTRPGPKGPDGLRRTRASPIDGQNLMRQWVRPEVGGASPRAPFRRMPSGRAGRNSLAAAREARGTNVTWLRAAWNRDRVLSGSTAPGRRGARCSGVRWCRGGGS
jgi:hypothetical protein